jgi:hypothetical protein
MTAGDKSVGWRFWAKWALASFLGLLVGMGGFVAVGILAGDAIDRLPEFVFGMLLGAIFGTTFGAAQWWVLRAHLRQVGAWIGATLSGFVVGAAIVFGLMNGSDPGTSLITKLGHGCTLGAALGIPEWFALRRTLDKASPWIAISVVSWVMAEVIGVALSVVVGPPFDLLGLFLVGAVLPGGGMKWLLYRASAASVSRAP